MGVPAAAFLTRGILQTRQHRCGKYGISLDYSFLHWRSLWGNSQLNTTSHSSPLKWNHCNLVNYMSLTERDHVGTDKLVSRALPNMCK
eukprot:4232767-Amphidinium_carterae.2